jgi:hypothetical protein
LERVTENFCNMGTFMSLHPAMVGKTRDEAVLRVVICCKDPDIQKALVRVIVSRGIMARYPGIGIHGCANPPGTLASDVSPITTDDAGVNNNSV